MKFYKLVSLHVIDITIEYVEEDPNVLSLFEYSLPPLVIAVLLVQALCFLNRLRHTYTELVGAYPLFRLSFGYYALPLL